MTSPMKNSRSQLDLDKTLIKAKPVTSQNRVLGAHAHARARAAAPRRSLGGAGAASADAFRGAARSAVAPTELTRCPMRAVTGGGGFLGSHLVDYLIARGDHVRAPPRALSRRRGHAGQGSLGIG